MKGGLFRSILTLLAAGLYLSTAGGVRGQAPAAPGGVGIGIGVFAPVAEQTPAAIPGLDLAKVSDAKAKAALEELGKKLATVKEAVIGEMKVTWKTAEGEGVTLGNAIVRRPNLVRGYEKTGRMEIWFVSDGKTYWSVTRITSKTGKQLPARIARTDLEKVKQAGLPTYVVEQNAFCRNPLAIADPATLKLESESDEAWTFTADAKFFPGKAKAAEKMTLSATCSKTDGLARKVVLSPNTTVTFDKIQVNPQPPIQDGVFAYAPQAGFEVHDSTDDLIKSLKEEN